MDNEALRDKLKNLFTRMPSDSPDVPDAVAQAIEKNADYVGDYRGTMVLLATLHLGAEESKIIVDGIVDQVRTGKLVVIYKRRLWDYDKQAYRYHCPNLIAASEVAMFGNAIKDAA